MIKYVNEDISNADLLPRVLSKFLLFFGHDDSFGKILKTLKKKRYKKYKFEDIDAIITMV